MESEQNSARSWRMAILIDGDNAQPSLIGNMLAETSKYGNVVIRRIFGDWTTANMNGWKDTLQTHAIQPIQQFRYTVGKNATDSAMIIDAMDVLYEDRVDGFCLVSSDSDYTRLATRIREKGVFVMGIGKKSTPRAFVNACDVFVFAENLQKENQPQPKKPKEPARKNEKAEKVEEIEQPPIEALSLLKQAFDLANLAYRNGATTNLEVVDAERRARDADTVAVVAEDASRQARLDLLAASGRFP